MNSPSRSSEPAAAQAEEAVRWRFSDVILDETSLELIVGGQKRELTRKPLEVLMFLLRNPGEVVTKDEIFEAVWPGRIVSETSLTNAIGRLRAALGEHNQEAIKAVYGYGYRFVAEVRRDGPPGGASSSSPAATFHFDIGAPVPHRGEWSFEKNLGGGGFGEVWLAAHRGSGEKRVFKFARNAAGFSSLKREITLFKLMKDSLDQRDDIVRLVDWNIEQEPYFLGQEWCEGGSLVQWTDSGGGIDKLSMELRLDLIAQTADALAAAHSVGVLHKDMKPSNLLVRLAADGTPRIKLADFGSARLLQRDRLERMHITQMGFTQTLTDSLSGTPLYLAPELIAGHPPTIQSDVYALGVILYQTVVGSFRRPLAPGWEREISDELLREDIAVAAAGNPEARLADAGQLAMRLRTLPQRRSQREQERIEVERAAVAQRAVDRAKARKGLTIALGVTMMIGLIATGALYLRANRARVEAVASAATAQSEAARANAVAAFLTDDLLSAGNPEIAGRRDVTVREVLDAAQIRLAERFKDQPRVEATLTRILGTAYAGLNEREPAERLLRKAEQALSAEVGPAAAETQATRMRLRDLYLLSSDGVKAEDTLTRVRETEKATGRRNLDFALEAEAQAEMLNCWNLFIATYVARCDEVADRGYRLALEKLGPESRATLSAALDAGDVRLKTGRGAEAVPFFRQAAEGLRKFHPDGGYLTLISTVLLGQALILSGQPAEALSLLDRDAALFARLYGPGERFVLTVRRWQARARLELGEPVAALATLNELRAIWLAKKDGLALDYAWIEIERARALVRLQRPAEAESALKDGMARIAPVEKPTGYWTLVLREQLADTRTAQQDRPDAERLLRRNLDEARSVFRKGEWLLGWCAYRLGDHLAADGRNTEALPLLQEALPILKASLGADERRTQQASERLAAAS
ncbi:MAG: protein kinase domain-containing protein [Panacagrimonas sp.]